MNILYLNHYAKPAVFGTPGRALYLSKVFRQAGHAMLIVCASHHHTRITPAPDRDINRICTYDGADYLHLPARPYQGNGLSRIRNMLDFGHGVDALAQWIADGRINRPDVIIASSVHIFVYPPAYRLAQKLKAKLIFEVRDIWPLSLVELAGVSKRHPLVWWMSHIERKAYRTADAVVGLVPKAWEHMASRGLNREKFHWIPNGVDVEEWEGPIGQMPETHQRVFDECRRQGKLAMVYAGAHGAPNALDQVLDIKKVIGNGEAPYHFIFIGDGSSKEALVARAKQEGISFITFLPRVPKKQVIPALQQADGCFIGWQKKDIYRYGISPNKLGDYFMAGKPVLHAVVAGNDPVAEAGAGLSMEPYQPEQLDMALRRFVSLGEEGRRWMGAQGKRYAMEKLDWNLLGTRYMELCRSLVEDHASH